MLSDLAVIRRIDLPDQIDFRARCKRHDSHVPHMQSYALHRRDIVMPLERYTSRCFCFFVLKSRGMVYEFGRRYKVGPSLPGILGSCLNLSVCFCT